MADHVILKILIYFFNFVLLLCGLALVVGGAIVQIHYKDYLSLDGKVFIAPILLIVAGVVIVLIAVFGCFGTCKRKSWTLIVFAILLSAVFLVEIAASIAAYVERHNVRGDIERKLNSTMTAIALGNVTANVDKIFWDKMQKQFFCCGVRSYNDWIATTGQVRDSCCKMNETGCTSQALITANCEQKGDIDINCPIYTTGCLSKAENYIYENINTVGGIGFGVAAVQILGVILAACLANKIRKDGEL